MSLIRNEKGEVRTLWRILYFVLLTGALSIPLMIIAGFGGSILSRVFNVDFAPPTLDELTQISFDSGWVLWGNLFILILLLSSSALAIRQFERRSFATLGYMVTPSTGKEIAQGIFLGWIAMTGIFILEVTLGVIHVQFNSELGFSFIVQKGSFCLIVFLVAGAVEELMCRGYLLQVLLESVGEVPAILTTSILFGVLHWQNPFMTTFSTVNLIIAGCVFAIAYLKTRSLWLPTALHVSWNFCQGFIYSQPVSGIALHHTVFHVTATGPAWLTGGTFGPEGGFLSTLASLGLIGYLINTSVVKVDPEMAAAWSDDVPPHFR